MKYKWKYQDTYGTNYYHDETGKIVGEVTRFNFGDDIHNATIYPDINLGNYINSKTAMKAVEESINSIKE